MGYTKPDKVYLATPPPDQSCHKSGCKEIIRGQGWAHEYKGDCMTVWHCKKCGRIR